jgi:hypothetical protein
VAFVACMCFISRPSGGEGHVVKGPGTWAGIVTVGVGILPVGKGVCRRGRKKIAIL